jgi:hypothetical protein
MSHQSGLIGEAGASVAEDPAALLPCLKERTWQGREHSQCRVLWANEASAYMPWVAVGYDSPHSFQFVSAKDFGAMQTTEAALEARAVANLRRRPATWEKVDVGPSAKGPGFTILACMDDFLAAERILDADFMNQAQRTLRARGLLVGIPRRGRLFCINGELAPHAIEAFGILVAQEFTAGESAVISPMLFAMKDGAIVAIVESVADAYLPELQKEQEEAGEDENASYVMSVVLGNDEGTEDVQLMIGGLDGARLARDLQNAFLGVLQKHIPRKEFSGKIEVVVLAHTPDEAKVHLEKVIAHVQGYCVGMATHHDAPLRVSLEYQKSNFPFPAKAAARSAANATPARVKAAAAAEPAPSLLSRVTVWILVVAILYGLKELIVWLFP